VLSRLGKKRKSPYFDQYGGWTVLKKDAKAVLNTLTYKHQNIVDMKDAELFNMLKKDLIIKNINKPQEYNGVIASEEIM